MGVHKGMKWDDHKGMEMNGMEWNVFKQGKWMENNENEWNVSNLVWSNMEGMEWNHFMTILQLNPYFKIKDWLYRGILGVLVKKSLNLISFLPI